MEPERSGDVSADELYDRYASAIERAIAFACARRRLRADEVDDAAQEVRLVLLRHAGRALRSFQGSSAAATYVFAIARRVIGRWMNRERHRAFREAAGGDTLPGSRFAAASTFRASIFL